MDVRVFVLRNNTVGYSRYNSCSITSFLFFAIAVEIKSIHWSTKLILKSNIIDTLCLYWLLRAHFIALSQYNIMKSSKYNSNNSIIVLLLVHNVAHIILLISFILVVVNAATSTSTTISDDECPLLDCFNKG